MKTFTVSGQRVIVPDQIFQKIKDLASSGVNINTAAQQVFNDIDSQVRNAGGLGSGSGDKYIRNELGFDSPNEFNVFMGVLSGVGTTNTVATQVFNDLYTGTSTYKDTAPTTASSSVSNKATTPIVSNNISTNTNSSTGSNMNNSTSSNVAPPQVALQPGSNNTTAVKQLQDWLVANGYMTQADVNTGYGVYGPRTTAAVLKVQQKLGIDNSTGPGYWGTRTLTAVNGVDTASKTNTSVPNVTQTESQATIVSPQKALLTAVADVAQNAAAVGKPPVSFADALDLAAKDPNIIAKYADMAKLDKNAFLQQIQTAQTQYGVQADEQKMQFENDRKTLAENMAASGKAYSGFRGKAQENLAKTEAGIITSSRSQQKQALDQLTSAFESKYGTGLTPTASITLTDPLKSDISISGLYKPDSGTDTLTGVKVGDITGTVEPAKKADILQSATNSYNTALFPQV